MAAFSDSRTLFHLPSMNAAAFTAGGARVEKDLAMRQPGREG